MEDIDETDFNEEDHDRLINALTKLDKTQHIKKPTRSEPTNLTSEFNLNKSSTKLDVNSVISVLENTSHHFDISKNLKKTQDAARVLPKPLEKAVAERIKRSTGFDATKKKLGRWDAVVARSRTVDHVSFPLRVSKNKLQPTKEFLSKFKLKSTLEMELDEVDPPAEENNDEEEEEKYPMTYQEMLEHRQGLAKMRAQQSFKAAKAKRQSKIKSKKYHRILKKEKLKQQLKEFEELQKTDPEEALKKLESLEKARAEERHTLRHKSTGKWAKNKLIRAKYDKEVRQQLADQLAISRGLTQKTQNVESSDDEPEINDGIPDVSFSQDPNNPWMLKRSDMSNIDEEFNFGYKKYLDGKMFKNKEDSSSDSDVEDLKIDKLEESLFDQAIDTGNSKDLLDTEKESTSTSILKNKKKKAVSTTNWIVESTEAVSKSVTKNIIDLGEAFDRLESGVVDKVQQKINLLKDSINKLDRDINQQSIKRKSRKENDDFAKLQFKNKKIRPIIDEQLDETTSKTPGNATSSVIPALKVLSNDVAAESATANIDPARFIQAKPKHLATALSLGDNDMDDLDDEEQVVPKVNIEDVFEEDDVVASFRQEKEDEINKDKPKDIDLSLPGWGSWGGKGVKAPKRKRNRFILKAPPKQPRRDDNKGDIVIKEYKDPKLAVHKLKELPFPFTSLKDFEASIRAPLGNTFIPETAHKKVIKPSVFTKAGTIIEPMGEEELLVPRNLNYKNHAVIKLLGRK